MAVLSIAFLCLLIITVESRPDQNLKIQDEDYNNVFSHEAVLGTGAHSSSITDGDEKRQNTGIYVFRRQRRSPHIGIGTHYYKPVYAQPIAVAPLHGHYPGHYYPQTQHLPNSQAQAQAISASFGGNHLLGGGGSGISAAAASAGSGTGNQLVPHGYGRK